MAKSYKRFILAGALAVGLTLPLGFEARADHDYTAACHERLQAQKAKIDRDAPATASTARKSITTWRSYKTSAPGVATTTWNGTTTFSM